MTFAERARGPFRAVLLLLLCAAHAIAQDDLGRGSAADGAQTEPRAAAPVPRFALVGAVVHTEVAGQEPQLATILIEGNHIAAVAADLEVPLGVERIDCTGLHIVPGLVDGMISYDPEHDALYTTSGITSVRDMGGDPDVVAQLKHPLFRERTPGPFLISAGGVLDGALPVSPASIVVRDADQVRQYLPLLREMGADFVSVMPRIDPALLPVVYDTAAELGLDVWGMLPSNARLEDCVEGGQRGFLGLDALLPVNPDTGRQFNWLQTLEFAFPGRAALLAESGAAMVPVVGEVQRRMVARSKDDPELAYLGLFYEAQWLADWHQRSAQFEEPDFKTRGATVHEKRCAALRALHAAGVELVPGSGAPLGWVMPGAALHDELALWVAAGLTPAETLRCVTSGAADVLGLHDRGRIAPGAMADLVVVAGDPTVDISVLRRPRSVVLRGRLLERTDLDEMLVVLAEKLAAERAENSRPLAVGAPERPSGALVLEGQVETRYLAERLSAERFEVVHRVDGSVAISSRLVQPPSGDFHGGEMRITQVLRDGLLESFVLRIDRRSPDAGGSSDEPSGSERGAVEAAAPKIDVMIVRGLWANNRFSVARNFNGSELGTASMVDRPIAITLDPLADTITTAFVVGQFPRAGLCQALTFKEDMEPGTLPWLIADSPDGSRWVRSDLGTARYEYLDNGAPVSVVLRSGGRTTYASCVAESLRDFGGAGFPVAFEPPPEETAPPVEPTPTEPPANESDGNETDGAETPRATPQGSGG